MLGSISKLNLTLDVISSGTITFDKVTWDEFLARASRISDSGHPLIRVSFTYSRSRTNSTMTSYMELTEAQPTSTSTVHVVSHILVLLRCIQLAIATTTLTHPSHTNSTSFKNNLSTTSTDAGTKATCYTTPLAFSLFFVFAYYCVNQLMIIATLIVPKLL